MSRAPERRPVLAVGAHVVFEGRTWQVVGLEGQVVRLVDEDGAVAAVLTGHLFAATDFAVVGATVRPRVPQWGLFQTVPLREQERALAWQRHIQEVETGLPTGPGGTGQPRPQYDPAQRTMAQRERAKMEELAALGWSGVGRGAVTRMRARYRQQGLWGLVDHRTTRPSNPLGRNDDRLVAAVLEALRRQRGRSKGTVTGLRQLTAQVLEETHGRGVVKMPAQSTFYRLAQALADPRELPGSPARTASAPARPFTPTSVQRPGEQVMLDTTRLDVLAVYDNGATGRPELTIALDAASRSILAAVLRPGGTKSVDAALLLAEMATPHPMRPGWPQTLSLSRAPVPYQRLLDADARLRDAAARPAVVPETVVVDRGRVFLSEAFLAACESLGVSVQPAPPRQPTAKGPVERTFGSINTLLCQHIAGHTGSNTTRRGANAEAEACWTLPQLQELLDEWITLWQSRPHEGLRHPMMPATALSPNEMWGALLSTCGYVPLPLTGRDWTELMPVRWKRITERGIRIDHRTYDHHTLNPHRGQPSGVLAQQGRWEVHHNPHDARQVWVRMPDGTFAAIPWIHRDHVHAPFSDHLWQHLKTVVEQRGNRDQYEADLAQALDDLLRRARTGDTTRREQALTNRQAPAAAPAGTGGTPTATGAQPPSSATGGPDARSRHEDNGNSGTGAAHTATDSLDHWDDADADEDDDGDPATAPGGGFALYDAHAEAAQW